jgi:hypothetical protein
VRSTGWNYPVDGQDWSGLADRYRTAPSIIAPIAEVVGSLVTSGLGHELRFTTSMWDLVVTPSPAGPPPLDVVAVRGAMGSRRVAEGRIIIEHLPLVGLADVIERDASDAVPLFWAFMREKYGLTRGS